MFINTTPHPITLTTAQFPDGEPLIVAPCGTLLSADAVETPAGLHSTGAELVRTTFVPSPAQLAALDALEAEHPGAIIIGSIIAAQAFPGRVFAMVPVPGFERVPPDQKRMRADKFTTF